MGSVLKNFAERLITALILIPCIGFLGFAYIVMLLSASRSRDPSPAVAWGMFRPNAQTSLGRPTRRSIPGQGSVMNKLKIKTY